MVKMKHLSPLPLRITALLLCGMLSNCNDVRKQPDPLENRVNTILTDDTSALPPAPLPTPFVVLLGTGTPVPDPARSGPSTAIVTENQAYIVDMGPGVVRRAVLAQQNGIEQLAPTKLSTAFVTHLHSDHTVGLPDLLYTPAVVGRKSPLTIYGPPGLKNMTKQIEAAFARDFEVRGAGRRASQMTGYQSIIHEITPGTIVQSERVAVTAFPVQHGRFEHAFGYRFDVHGRSVVISGDTAPSPSVIEACNGCDVLVHEAYCQAGFDHGPQSWQRYHASYHTSAVELGKLAARAKPRLLLVTHLLFFGCSEDQLIQEIRQGFDGNVIIGQDLGIY